MNVCSTLLVVFFLWPVQDEKKASKRSHNVPKLEVVLGQLQQNKWKAIVGPPSKPGSTFQVIEIIEPGVLPCFRKREKVKLKLRDCWFVVGRVELCSARKPVSGVREFFTAESDETTLLLRDSKEKSFTLAKKSAILSAMGQVRLGPRAVEMRAGEKVQLIFIQKGYEFFHSNGELLTRAFANQFSCLEFVQEAKD